MFEQSLGDESQDPETESLDCNLHASVETTLTYHYLPVTQGVAAGRDEGVAESGELALSR